MYPLTVIAADRPGAAPGINLDQLAAVRFWLESLPVVERWLDEQRDAAYNVFTVACGDDEIPPAGGEDPLPTLTVPANVKVMARYREERLAEERWQTRRSSAACEG